MNEDTRLVLKSIEDLRAEMNTKFEETEARLNSRIDNVESRLNDVEKLVNISLKAIDENYRLIKEIRAKQDETDKVTQTNCYDIALLRNKAQAQ